MNDESKKLREMVRILERKFGVLQESELSCCGITLSQCHALIEVGRKERISLNQLAQILNLDNSTLSRTVNKLVNKNLVERKVGTEDRRFVTISLSSEGIKLYEMIERNMNNYFSNIYDRIPDSKKQEVLESIKLLIDAFDGGNCC